MTTYEILRDRYHRVATRYGQLIGPPPPLSPDAATLAQSIRDMLATLDAQPEPQARGPLTTGDIALHITIGTGEPELFAVVDLLDATGRRVRTPTVTFPISLDATLATITDGARERALETPHARTTE